MQVSVQLPIGPPGPLHSLAISGGTFPVFEMQTSPTDRICLLGIEMYQTNNTAGGLQQPFGLGRSATPGVGVLSSSILRENSGDTTVLPNCTFYTQWASYPSIPTNYLRRMTANMSATGNA